MGRMPLEPRARLDQERGIAEGRRNRIWDRRGQCWSPTRGGVSSVQVSGGGNEVKSEASEVGGVKRGRREERMNASLCVRIELEFPRYTEAEQGGPRL